MDHLEIDEQEACCSFVALVVGVVVIVVVDGTAIKAIATARNNGTTAKANPKTRAKER